MIPKLLIATFALLAAFSTALAEDAISIGVIDFYGLRTITEEEVRAALPFSEGFALSPNLALAEEAMEADIAEALGVSRVRLTLVCCHEPNALVAYVGIEEQPGIQPLFRDAPDGEGQLPAEFVETAQQVDIALQAAIRAGDAGDDWTMGHSLSTNPGVRALQERYIGFADEYHELLVGILHGSARGRALAATVLAYSADKQAIVPHLEAAVLDPDPAVRNAALRALMVIAAYANDHPELPLNIGPDPLVLLLDSIEQSDRHKASAVLFFLTESGDPVLLVKLQASGLPSLIDMCRWTLEGHSTMPCKVLERVAGLPESDEMHSKATTISAAQALMNTRMPGTAPGD